MNAVKLRTTVGKDGRVRLPRLPLRRFTSARDETGSLTAHIAQVEREIDERVAALYGL